MYFFPGLSALNLQGESEMKKYLPMLASALLFVYAPQAHSMTIYGSLSNFDCTDEETEPCDGFEIEIEDHHREEVVHTYNYSRFGAPSVSEVQRGIHTNVLIRYKNPLVHMTFGEVTHFGVSLSRPAPASAIHYRWLRTFGGVEQPIDYIVPIHEQELKVVNGKQVIEDRIINPSSYKTFWLLVHEQVVNRNVRLEELMTDNPVVTEANDLSGEYEELPPMGQYFNVEDAPGDDDEDTTVFWYEVYKSNRDSEGEPIPGPYMCSIMDGTNTLNVSPSTISGSINLQSLAVSSQGHELWFELKQNGQIVSSPVTHIDATGHYSIQTQWSGPTEVRMKANHWLVKNLGIVNLAGTTVTLNASLINGDVDNSNDITTDDYLWLSDSFDLTVGDPGFVEGADLDENGIVNTDDYLILSENFDKVGDN